MKQNQPIAFSIGTSHAPIWYFRYLLLKHRIDVLVDCRSFPQSRFASQYNKNAFRLALEAKKIKYLYRGRNLGGKLKNINYAETIDELATLVRSGVRIALCCSEKSPENCHRKTLLEPSFNERGIEIMHILHSDEPIKKLPRSKQQRLL
jgi:uncharacterized protein (DUF488 family)